MTCPCDGSCACHGGSGAFPPPCDVPGGCGSLPRCAVDRCTDGPDPVICTFHARQLGDHLTDVGVLYDRLSAAPSMAGREPGTGHGGTLPSHRNVGDLRVMALRDPRTAADDGLLSVLGVLHGWAEQVREGRKLAHPRTQLTARIHGAVGPVCNTWCRHWSCIQATWRWWGDFRPTVATERKLLAAQLDPWILAQDWAGVFYAEIRDLWRLLQPAGPAIPRPRRACPVDGCAGVVSVTGMVAECGGCGAYWEGLDVARLGVAA